jgi:predicted MFS family arabinose efflux permease
MVCLVGAGGVLLSTQQALLTDLVAPDRHEHAFASARVVQNIGFVLGPLFGAALLLISWRVLFLGTGAIAGLAFVVALEAIPRETKFASRTTPPNGAPARRIVRDPSFLILLAAGTLAAMVYVSYVTLLPISLVQSHGVTPTTWGLLVAINPVVVVLCQFRLTNQLGWASEFARIAAGIVAMGMPFLFLAVSAALPVLVLMLLVFVLGEMLWVPPSQAVVARSAPDDMRGAYLGASSAALPAALATAPLIGLHVRGAFGDSAMWIFVAIAGALAIALYGAAVRFAGRHASAS